MAVPLPDSEGDPRAEAAAVRRRRWLLAGLGLLCLVGLALLVAVATFLVGFWAWTEDPAGVRAPWPLADANLGPRAFEPEARHVEALFDRDDLARGFELAPSNGPRSLHAQDEATGWYLKLAEGEMDEPGVAVGCALDVTGDAARGRERFGSWRRLQGFEEGFTRIPAFELEPLAFEWGDASLAAILREEGRAVGNSVLVRSGERVVLVEWRGRVVGGSAALEALLVPSLEALMDLER